VVSRASDVQGPILAIPRARAEFYEPDSDLSQFSIRDSLQLRGAAPCFLNATRRIEEDTLLKAAGRLGFYFEALLVLGAMVPAVACGQTVRAEAPGQPFVSVAQVESAPLPEAPEPVNSSSVATSSSVTGSGNDDGKAGDRNARTRALVAGPHTKFIQPGEMAPPLTVGDKIILGLRSSVSPSTALGWVVAAGYEQVANKSPNYGQTGTGFAQRLGAAAARNASEDIFADAVLAPVLHEDPRYYKMGDAHNVFARVTYAVTRVVITRTDSGGSTLNIAVLGGNLAGSALTQAYYPPPNRGFKEVAETFGGSLGGSALHFAVGEFIGDLAEAVHLKHAE
jgi:hypothetical protein